MFRLMSATHESQEFASHAPTPRRQVLMTSAKLKSLPPIMTDAIRAAKMSRLSRIWWDSLLLAPERWLADAPEAQRSSVRAPLHARNRKLMGWNCFWPLSHLFTKVGAAYGDRSHPVGTSVALPARSSHDGPGFLFGLPSPAAKESPSAT